MTACGRAVSIAEQVADGRVLSSRQMAHVAGCAACRAGLERARDFPPVLRAAARSILAEAAGGVEVSGQTAAAGWFGAITIEPRAFAPFGGEGRWPWRGLAAAVAGLAIVAVLAVTVALPAMRGTAGDAPIATRSISAILGEMLASGYDCRAARQTRPGSGLSPGYVCTRIETGLGEVAATVRANLANDFASLSVVTPATGAAPDTAVARSSLRALVTLPYAVPSDAAAARAWVDALFEGSGPPASTQTRIGGLDLRLVVGPGAPWDLEITAPGRS
jgi:hypothetical protein